MFNNFLTWKAKLSELWVASENSHVTSLLKPLIFFILESAWPVYPFTEPFRSDDRSDTQNHLRSPSVDHSRSTSVTPRRSTLSNTQTSSPSVPRPSTQSTELVHSNSSKSTGSQSSQSQSSGSRSLTDLARSQSSGSRSLTDVHCSQSSGSHSLTDLTRFSLTQLPRPTEDGFKGLYKSFLKRNS